MQRWNAHESADNHDADSYGVETYAPCGCSPQRVNYLVGLLIDGAENGALNSAELQDARAELASCELCYKRLEQEERLRALLNRCCSAVDEGSDDTAPRSLRERIIVSIRTEQTTVRTSRRRY